MEEEQDLEIARSTTKANRTILSPNKKPNNNNNGNYNLPKNSLVHVYFSPELE